MSAYADTHTGTRHGSHRLPNGSNVGLPLPPQDQTGQLMRSNQVPGVLPVPTCTGTNDSQPPAPLADTTPRRCCKGTPHPKQQQQLPQNQLRQQ